MATLLATATNLFPLWVLLGGAAALVWPALFTWFHGQAIVWGLAVVILGMGVTLSVDDFRGALRTPGLVAIGFVGQFTIRATGAPARPSPAAPRRTRSSPS